MKKIIASNEAPAAIGPYSQAIMLNDTLYISGQLPISATTGEMPEDIESQTRQSLLNIGAILKSASLTYEDVVKTTVLMTDLSDFARMNAVYAEFFNEMKPARACFQVAALPKGAKIEIEAIAGK
ncbi:MAG: RidA family protein [Alistipes sp.]|nr:RidA family protein [Candidatus Alistipes equi]